MKLLTPEERQTMLRMLKRGPAFGRRQLGDGLDRAGFAVYAYGEATGRDLKKECDKYMKEWKKGQK